MPLHVGDNHDKGGNQTQVRFYDRGTNMHRLWDSDIIQRAGDDEDFWMADLASLDTPKNREAAMKGKVEDWATESLLAARAAYQVPETGKRLKPGQKLSDAYYNANLPLVQERLYQASIRLAMLLNEAFSRLARQAENTFRQVGGDSCSRLISSDCSSPSDSSSGLSGRKIRTLRPASHIAVNRS